MELTQTRRDALTELINIGYGRAAAALSEMTSNRVLLQAPALSLHPIKEVTRILCDSFGARVACVTQVFSGPIAGNAMLLLDSEAAIRLTQILDARAGNELGDGAMEVLTETGNILLNACLGVFGNLLSVQVAFALPRVEVNTVDSLFASITTGWEPLSHGLVIRTQFQLSANDVSGVLLIVFGVASLDRWLLHLDKWAATT